MLGFGGGGVWSAKGPVSTQGAKVTRKPRKRDGGCWVSGESERWRAAEGMRSGVERETTAIYPTCPQFHQSNGISNKMASNVMKKGSVPNTMPMIAMPRPVLPCFFMWNSAIIPKITARGPMQFAQILPCRMSITIANMPSTRLVVALLFLGLTIVSGDVCTPLNAEPQFLQNRSVGWTVFPHCGQ